MRKEDISTLQNPTATIHEANLYHREGHFRHPRDVITAEELSKEEKRAILASWASDIFAIEAAPALRIVPGTDVAVSYDEILDALKSLDITDPTLVGQDLPVGFVVDGRSTRRHGVHRSALRQCRLRKTP